MLKLIFWALLLTISAILVIAFSPSLEIGLALCLVPFVGVVLLLISTSESFLLQELQVTGVFPEGFEGTWLKFKKATPEIRTRDGKLPLIYFSPNTTQSIWVFRGIYGSGSIVISEGALRTLSEIELLTKIKEAVFRSRNRRVYWMTLALGLSARIDRLKKEDALVSIFGAVTSLLLLPWHEWLQRVAGRNAASPQFQRKNSTETRRPGLDVANLLEAR